MTGMHHTEAHRDPRRRHASPSSPAAIHIMLDGPEAGPVGGRTVAARPDARAGGPITVDARGAGRLAPVPPPETTVPERPAPTPIDRRAVVVFAAARSCWRSSSGWRSWLRRCASARPGASGSWSPTPRRSSSSTRPGSRSPSRRSRGHPVLVFFGYTHCPDVCPATIGMLNQVLADAGDGPRALFISIDPERDGPGRDGVLREVPARGLHGPVRHARSRSRRNATRDGA